MASRLLLGNIMVNLDHITKADFAPAYSGGEEMEDEAPGTMTRARPAVLELTLTSVHLSTYEAGMTDPQLAAASVSDTVKVRGELAERAWTLLCAGALLRSEEA